MASYGGHTEPVMDRLFKLQDTRILRSEIG